MGTHRTGTPRLRTITAAALLTVALLATEGAPDPARAAQDREERPAPAGPAAGLDSPTTAESANELFTTAGTCALCHTTSAASSALRDAAGRDVSPVHTWRGTLMASSFRDPYWRAKVEHELSAVPAAERSGVAAFCLRCHGPMASRSADLLATPAPSVEEAAGDPLAADGVSCTLCHQIRDDGLGTPASYTAGFVIRPGRTAFGPYADPFAMPMLRHSGFRPEHAPHVARSAVCGTCHTLFTREAADGPEFLEQAPYLEWRNSAYSDEGGATPTSRTCVDCHMENAGSLRIAHNPMGRDFPRLAARENVRSHAIAGGNAFMLRVLEDGWETVGLVADTEQVGAALDATRATLRKAATLAIGDLTRDTGTLAFDVTVTNLTGHKLPSGYPARRVWLRVQVVADGRVAFDSGAFDDAGRIVGPADESAVPHTDVVTDATQVVVYEARPVDAGGRPTLLLREMQGLAKDSRLLPRGWRPDGPDAAATRPVGVDGDADFRGGSDTVTYRVPLPAESAAVTVRAWLLYQALPPAWVEPLRELGTPYATAFVAMFDAADRSPEVLATASARR